MINQKAAFNRLLATGLAIALVTYGVISYPLSLVVEIATSTVLLALVLIVGHWLLGCRSDRRSSSPEHSEGHIETTGAGVDKQHPFEKPLGLDAVLSLSKHTHPPGATRPALLARFIAKLIHISPRFLTPSPIAFFLLTFSTVVTVQAIVARQTYGPLQAIDSTLGYGLCVRLLHYAFVAAIVLTPSDRFHQVGLVGALGATSILYTPTFANPEAGPSFVPLAALALVLLSTGFANRELRITFPFLLCALVATFFSHSPQDSLTWFLKLLTLLGFTLSIPRFTHTRVQWRRLALIVIILGVIAPTCLSMVKLVELTGQLGVDPAAAYRLGLNELGRANLIARTLMIGAPLLVSWAWTSVHRVRRILWWSLAALASLAFITSRSWDGWIGVSVTSAVAIILHYGRFWLGSQGEPRFTIRQFLSGAYRTWGSGGKGQRQRRPSRSRATYRGQAGCLESRSLGFDTLRYSTGARSPKIWIRPFLSMAGVIVITGITLLGLLWLAPRSRIGSFNGRLFQFRAALRQIAHHPLLGVGPGHYFLKSRYAADLGWLVDTQVTLDHPVNPVRWLRGSTRLHFHNLFLEIGAGTGVLGLGAFLWFLVGLFRYGLRTRARLEGENRILLTGCLLGIVASLGWGLLDVMEISPPFFTFPTWALVGLVLAAPRALGAAERRGKRWGFQRKASDRRPSSPRRSGGRIETTGAGLAGPLGLNTPLAKLGALDRRSLERDDGEREREGARKEIGPRITHYALRFTFYVLLAAFILFAVISPLISNAYYRPAYAAYQQHQWEDVVTQLTRASRWEPLNAKYHQLRGEALINLGRYDEAITAYERAVRLKRDFAPYHNQLGWLHWLQGDLDQAIVHFEKAVEMDPREAWRDGLHADLAICEWANGRESEEAIVQLFKETIELDPQMAGAAYWAPVRRADGAFDVVLDPAYYNGGESLEVRILVHLGKADHTPRLFPYSLPPTPSPLSLTQALDAIEADYEVSRAEGSREAPRYLATVAEAARAAGLEARAEETYLRYQDAFPDSAYGFRELGALYAHQDRLDEAYAMLENAVGVSPEDTGSWLALAEVALTQSDLEGAATALHTVARQSPLNARLYELQAQHHRQQGDPAQAAEALREALVIQESLSNRLELAALYRTLGQPQKATHQCLAAADALRRTWPRPFDPQLWDLATCLAHDERDAAHERVVRAYADVHVRHILRGHIHRARGELPAALRAYEQAATARPESAAPFYFLGETYQALGDPVAAEDAYRQAAALSDVESLPYLALGRLQWAQGQPEDAVVSFRAAVQTTPGWAEAHLALGNALLALDDRTGADQHYRQAQLVSRELREGVWYDFAAHLAEADIATPDPNYVRYDTFTLAGERKRVLFAHPPARISYTLTLPTSPVPAGGIEGGGTLTFDIATSPDSWEQAGDGVQFDLDLDDGRVRQPLLSAYLDPKHIPAHRAWRAHEVDLTPWAGQTVTLTFATSCGPADNCEFDWAGWGAPRVVGR